MPFLIRPSRRFPVCCPVTYECGLFEGHGTVWNLSLTGFWQHYPTQEGKSMNADQLKGKWMQFKGDLKQQWGKFTDNDLQQIGGSFDKILGMLQERYGGNCFSLVRGRYGRFGTS
jgi:uncharacterized protein YjbJ (UPF0337 family)